MSQGSFKQFCPVAMAAEILCTRWTVLILREMLVGTSRFNDLRRGVPRMSPALLSQRLKELEAAGILTKAASKTEPGVVEYRLTPAGRELEPFVMALGQWGQRWVSSELSMQHLDAQLLMWDMRRNLDPTPMPPRKTVVQFCFEPGPAKDRDWWLIVEPDEPVDLCRLDPGLDPDIEVATDLRTMTAIWMGFDTVKAAREAQRLEVVGDPLLAGHMQTWLGLSPFAKTPRPH
jgi:DNA-binding HxlR family transcriptional regulator